MRCNAITPQPANSGGASKRIDSRGANKEKNEQMNCRPRNSMGRSTAQKEQRCDLSSTFLGCVWLSLPPASGEPGDLFDRPWGFRTLTVCIPTTTVCRYSGCVPVSASASLSSESVSASAKVNGYNLVLVLVLMVVVLSLISHGAALAWPRCLQYGFPLLEVVRPPSCCWDRTSMEGAQREGRWCGRAFGGGSWIWLSR